MSLTDKQCAIISALHVLPAGSPVRRISQAVDSLVTVADMRPLCNLELVMEVERQEPPLLGYKLTPEGEKMATEIRRTRPQQAPTPEMAAPVPISSARDRVSREELYAAVAEGRSLAWMSLRFDCSARMVQELIDEYGLRMHTPAAEAAEEARAVEVGDRMQAIHAEYKAEIAQQKSRASTARTILHPRFVAGEGTTWKEQGALARELGLAHTTVTYQYKVWRSRRPQAPIIEPESAQVEVAPGPAESSTPVTGVAVEETPTEVPPAADPASVESPAQPEVRAYDRPIQGQVYEGTVCKVFPDYVLVELDDFLDDRGKHLTGKVSKGDLRDGKFVVDCRNEIDAGTPVNVLVRSLNFNPGTQRWYIILSVRDAPAHELMEWRGPRPGSLGAPGGARLTATGAEVAQALATETPTTWRPQSRTSDEEAQTVQIRLETAEVDKCPTCVHQLVCRLSDLYAGAVELADADKPQRLQAVAVAVTYGRRPVQECSVYRRE